MYGRPSVHHRAPLLQQVPHDLETAGGRQLEVRGGRGQRPAGILESVVLRRRNAARERSAQIGRARDLRHIATPNPREALMRRLLAVTVLVLGLVSTQAAAQQAASLRIGAHVAGNTMNGPFDLVRVGGHLLIPVGKRFDVYPAVSRFLDGAKWEVSIALRYRPLSSPDGMSPWYIGGGWAAINWGPT